MRILKNHGPLWALGALLLNGSLAGAQRALPTDTLNIAAASRGGRVLSASSMLDNQEEYSAKNLIDEQVYTGSGKGSFGWVSNRYDPINMEYVTLGFKDNALRTIGKIAINPAAFVARERWAKDVSVQVSSESAEGPFTPVLELTLRQSPERQEFKFMPVEARFVRIQVRTNYGSDRAVALGEVELYEAIDTNDKFGDVIGRLEGTIADLKKFQQTQLDLSNSSPTVRPVNMGAGASPASLNIAASANGGKARASTTFESEQGSGADPAYGPDKLIDGKIFSPRDPKNSTGGWASQGFVPGDQWVIIGFKDDRTQPVGKIVINPASDQPRERWARRVDVQVSTEPFKDRNDLRFFRTIRTLNLRTEPVPQEFDIGPVEAKYVRLVFTANGPGDIKLEGFNPDINSNRAVSLGEIEIYPPRISSGELEALISRLSQVLTDLKQIRRSGPQIATTATSEENAEVNFAVDEELAEATEAPEVTVAKINDAGTRIKTTQTPARRPQTTDAE